MTGLTLVTGASGLIGRYLLRRLLAEGVPVRAMVRRPAGIPPDLRDRVEVVIGDIRDVEALGRAVQGSSTVLHLAACAQAWARDPGEFTAANVDAVRDLLHFATEGSVERIVHVSTILTFPPYRPGPGGAGRPLTPYEISKKAGEELVDAYAATGRFAVVVHPTRVYGPGPLNDANGVTRAMALYLRGRLRVRLDDGDVLANYVHADDVAAGIIAAARQGRRGAHYLLGGENITFRGLLQTASAVAGIDRRVFALPARLALAVGGAAELLAYVGGRPPITRSWVWTFLEDRRADIGPAQDDLGYRPRGVREGLEETIEWLRRTGVIRA